MAARTGTADIHPHFVFFLQQGKSKSIPVLGYYGCSFKPCNCEESANKTKVFAEILREDSQTILVDQKIFDLNLSDAESSLEKCQVTLIDPKTFNWNTCDMERLCIFLIASVDRLHRAVCLHPHPINRHCLFELGNSIPDATLEEPNLASFHKNQSRAILYRLAVSPLERYPEATDPEAIAKKSKLLSRARGSTE